MSRAENLLNSIQDFGEEIQTTSFSVEDDRIVVEERNIIVPKSLKYIAVTGDKDVETIPIDVGRYWDGHDLSTFAIYLNYILPDRTEGTYIPNDIFVSDNKFSFNWTIGREMTAIAGVLSFSIVAKKTDEMGDLLYQWGSFTSRDCSIAAGQPVSNVPDVEEEKDLVSQILSALNEKVSKTSITNDLGESEDFVISQKGATDAIRSISDMNDALSVRTSENERDIIEIKENNEITQKRIYNLEHGISAEPFVTDSTSSLKKSVPTNALPYAEILKVGGANRTTRNLIKYPYYDTTKTENGITFTDNGDGTVTVNGTATADAAFDFIAKGWGTFNLQAGDYWLSGVPYGANSLSSIVFTAQNADRVEITSATDTGTGRSFNLSEPATRVYFRIRIRTGAAMDNVIFKPMLSYGNEFVSFEPYYEGIREAKVTKIESRSSDGTVLQTINIPSSVKNLMGYGQGNPENEEEYNYIDFERRVFVAKGVFEIGSWSSFSEEQETDISGYISRDNFINVVGGGTVSFETEEKIGAPSEITYMVRG